VLEAILAQVHTHTERERERGEREKERDRDKIKINVYLVLKMILMIAKYGNLNIYVLILSSYYLSQVLQIIFKFMNIKIKFLFFI